MKQTQPAMGTVGYLIRVMDDRQYIFRVYDGEHNFVDYDILHYDMRIQIQDEDATFYTNEVGDYINHSPDTLGHTK